MGSTEGTCPSVPPTTSQVIIVLVARLRLVIRCCVMQIARRQISGVLVPGKCRPGHDWSGGYMLILNLEPFSPGR